jgi:hypothetical protein
VANIQLEKPVFVKDNTQPYYRITEFDTETSEFTVLTVVDLSVSKRSWRINYDLLADNDDRFTSRNNTKEVFKYLYSIGMRNFDNVPEEILYELENRGQPTEELLEVLRKIEDGSILLKYTKEANYTFITSEDPDYDFDGLCCAALIKSDGQHNSFEAQKLKDSGFNVFPLERDSFGWLIGGVKTSKGIISYG